MKNGWRMTVSALFVSLIMFVSQSAAIAAETNEAGRTLDDWFGIVNGYLAQVFFVDVLFFIEGVNFPLIVAWLIVGAVFLTIRMGFINFRLLGHSVAIIRGKYRAPGATGEVTPFQALTTALSATVGLGNIAGVNDTITRRRPGP